MDRWLENYAKPTVKLPTYCSYEQYIRSHIKPQIRILYLNKLRVDDLQDFFNGRRQNGIVKGLSGLSPKTLTRPCLKIGGMPNGERFFRQSRQIFAGRLSPGKKI